jgi:hypothetical protein
MRILFYIIVALTINASHAEASINTYSKGCHYIKVPNKYPTAINVGWK